LSKVLLRGVLTMDVVAVGHCELSTQQLDMLRASRLALLTESTSCPALLHRTSRKGKVMQLLFVALAAWACIEVWLTVKEYLRRRNR
jgi:hypothetical protein